MSLQYRRSSVGGGDAKPPAVDWELFEETLARVDPCFSDPRFDSLKHVLTVLSSSNAEQEVAEVRMAGPVSTRRAVGTGMAGVCPCAARLPCRPAHQPTKPPPPHRLLLLLGALCCLHHLLLPWPSVLPTQLREQRAATEELVDAVVEGYHAGFNKSIHNYSLILRLFTESRLQVGGEGSGAPALPAWQQCQLRLNATALPGAHQSGKACLLDGQLAHGVACKQPHNRSWSRCGGRWRRPSGG